MDRVTNREAAPQKGFPRRRGDGPWQARYAGVCPMFSPQARGWTVTGSSAVLKAQVFPAGAGMDPLRTTPWSCSRSFPRRRGDGPSPCQPIAAACRFSPQARGWTRPKVHAVGLPPVFPAGAGMDPFRQPSPSGPFGFPRRRGDGPSGASRSAGRSSFSPQARGWTRRHARVAGVDRVFPAGAGMDPRTRRRRRVGRSFPRRRGDGPWARRSAIRSSLFSPQARGWTA